MIVTHILRDRNNQTMPRKLSLLFRYDTSLLVLKQLKRMKVLSFREVWHCDLRSVHHLQFSSSAPESFTGDPVSPSANLSSMFYLEFLNSISFQMRDRDSKFGHHFAIPPLENNLCCSLQFVVVCTFTVFVRAKFIKKAHKVKFVTV
jgi:hypothetical protein